jgi:hypothetical protein
MRNVMVENAVRWMLAASMLLSASVMSSTYVHAHGGGDLLHQHGGAGDVHSCEFDLAASHDVETCLESGGTHSHLFFMLWGAKICVPAAERPAGAGARAELPCGQDTAVCFTSSASVLAVTRLASIDQTSSTFCLDTAGGSLEPKRAVSFCAGLPQVSLLCDRARHERSGVQQV